MKVGDKVIVEGKETEIVSTAYDGCREKIYGVKGSFKEYYASEIELLGGTNED